jgi:type I restriction enzyme M protein
MVNLIFDEDDEVLTDEGAVRTVYDPACGTGGMLSVAEDHIRRFNEHANLHVFGQELNPESYAVCNSDMLIKGQDPNNIAYGNSFTDDGFPNQRFDYMLSNPPFGVSWKKVKDEIEAEHEDQGLSGRFGAGTPRVNDGALLFLQHMLSKIKPPEEGGSRIAIVFNGSPMFTGGPNSGESAIRRWIIENDWLEGIVQLPRELFYNTKINTYIWVLNNDKPKARKNKIQLIDSSDMYEDMKDNLGEKSNKITGDHINEITEIFGDMEANGRSVVVDSKEFGYRRIVIDRPLRMSFRATSDRIESLSAERAFTNRDEETQKNVKEALSTLDSDKKWMDKDEFIEEVELCFNMHGIDVRNSVYDAIQRALGERNQDANIVTNAKGDPEHDTELRERERVPLKEDVEEYFKQEVEPYTENAWINKDNRYYDDKDGELGVVGYEINFNRYFYEYNPPRSLDEIDGEIEEIEEEISKLLDKVAR